LAEAKRYIHTLESNRRRGATTFASFDFPVSREILRLPPVAQDDDADRIVIFLSPVRLTLFAHFVPQGKPFVAQGKQGHEPHRFVTGFL
jgi:hypothetical protein